MITIKEETIIESVTRVTASQEVNSPKAEENMATKYWLVGATEDSGTGTDRSPEWYKKGIWKLMWDEGEKPIQDARLDKMKVGDRIAIKSMNGQGAKDITIKAIGIIHTFDREERTAYITWVLTGLKRVVDSGGCFSAIHGPYKSNNWIRRIFTL